MTRYTYLAPSSSTGSPGAGPYGAFYSFWYSYSISATYSSYLSSSDTLFSFRISSVRPALLVSAREYSDSPHTGQFNREITQISSQKTVSSSSTRREVLLTS